MTVEAEPADQLRARKKVESLARQLYRPVLRATKLNVATIATGTVAGVVVALLTRQVAWAAATTAIIASLGGFISWAWLRDARDRAAFELLSDHDCHEAAEWKTETGTSIPTTVAGVRRWLRDHPDSPGRATMLTRLGRFGEASAVIDAMTPDTPEDAFGVEIQRKSIELYAGGRPDVASLHAEWRSLPDPRERRHRRECLAILDAQIAIESGGDPWSVLASARAELDDVHPSQRAWRIVTRFAILHALVVLTVTLAAVFVVG